MDFVCKHCAKTHGLMMILDGEMIHLSCLKELVSDESEVVVEIIEE